MTTAEANPDQVATLTEAALLAMIPEALEPGAYLVIPVGVLARQIPIDWWNVSRENKGEVLAGKFSIKHLRSLLQLGHIVNSRYADRERLET